MRFKDENAERQWISAGILKRNQFGRDTLKDIKKWLEEIERSNPDPVFQCRGFELCDVVTALIVEYWIFGDAFKMWWDDHRASDCKIHGIFNYYSLQSSQDNTGTEPKDCPSPKIRRRHTFHHQLFRPNSV